MSLARQHPDRLSPPGGGAAASRFARELKRARRHSVVVRLLRVGLPLLGFGIVAGGLAVTYAARQVPPNVSIASASLAPDGIVMNDPRMSGFDGSNRPYEMTALRAVQALDGSGVDLERVDANLSMSDSTTAKMSAGKGYFDPKAQTLRLTDAVRVVTSDAMTITLATADVDVRGGGLDGTGPVRIVSPSQTLESETIAVRDRGASLRFRGRVRMIINPSAGGFTFGQDPSGTP